jgi:hypothetical protein
MGLGFWILIVFFWAGVEVRYCHVGSLPEWTGNF